MGDEQTTFKEVKSRLQDFNGARDWHRYHNPKDLAVSISIESAELLENFQWKPALGSDEIKQDEEVIKNVKDEVADLLIYLFILADGLNIDISQAMLEKIQKNEERFEIA